MSTININQFAPTPVLGDLDLSIQESSTLSGMLASSVVTSLPAGTPVKIDATVTAGAVIQFVAAGATDLAFGTLKRTAQASTFTGGDKVEVVGDFGPVMWLNANTTMAPGIPVQSNASDATIVEAVSSGKVRGILLDPGSASTLVRVMLINPVTVES